MNFNKKNILKLKKIIPSIVTLASLCFGISALKLSLIGRWQEAIIFVIIAAILDAFDGKIARSLKAESKFGAHLDSLSDFINFGLIPPLLVYIWQLGNMEYLGWLAVLFFTICSAIRLARFNTEQDNEDIKEKTQSKINHNLFFTGVPSPAGAMACLAPIMISFISSEISYQTYQNFMWVEEPIFLALYLIFISILGISNLPVYSVKKGAVGEKYLNLFKIIVALLLIAVIIYPFITTFSVIFLYYTSILISSIHYYKAKNAK